MKAQKLGVCTCFWAFIYVMRLNPFPNPQLDADGIGYHTALFDVFWRDGRIDNREDDMPNIRLHVSGKRKNRGIGGFSVAGMTYPVIRIGVGGVQADGDDVEESVPKRCAVFSVDEFRLPVGVDANADVGNFPDAAADIQHIRKALGWFSISAEYKF